MPQQPCIGTDDGVHIPLEESVSVKSNLSDSVVVKVICAACGARGEAVVAMAQVVWAPPLRSVVPGEV
jgi:hypothetical protein